MSSNRSDLVKMGKHISDLRKGLGYTQKQLGELIDVSDKTISKWEQGDLAPDITILNTLASNLNVTIEEILTGEKIDEKTEEISNPSESRYKVIKKILLFSFAVLVSVSFILYLENYYEWKLTKIELREQFYIDGYLLNNHEKSKIVLDNIRPLNNEVNDNTFIKSLEINLYDKDLKIYNKKIIYDYPISLYDAFQNLIVSLQINNKIDYNDVIIQLKFINNFDEEKVLTYNFKEF